MLHLRVCSYLNDDHPRTTFLKVLEQTRRRHQFHVFGYVLMPEHVHLLLSEPKLQPLSNTFRVLKGETPNPSDIFARYSVGNAGTSMLRHGT